MMVFYKLATFCPVSFCWKDGKVRFASEAEAVAAARRCGKYRVSRVDGKRREDLPPFEVQ